MNISVDDFLKSLCLSTYHNGFVFEEHTDEIRNHPAFNVEIFMVKCDPPGIEHPDQRTGYFIYDKWGWEYKTKKQQDYLYESRPKPKKEPTLLEIKVSLMKDIKVALAEADIDKVITLQKQLNKMK